MTAQIVKGVTFATGGTYTAGHFNDYMRQATISAIDRTTIDPTVGTFITRDALPPPGPGTKEAFIDSSPTSILSLQPIRTYTGGIFSQADAGEFYFGFNNGNGSAFIGSPMGCAGVVNGYPQTSVAALATGAHIAVACIPEESANSGTYLMTKLFGVVKVRVIHACSTGDFLGPSGTLGVLTADTTYNTERDSGSNTPQCYIQAMESSADTGVKLILARMFR